MMTVCRAWVTVEFKQSSTNANQNQRFGYTHSMRWFLPACPSGPSFICRRPTMSDGLKTEQKNGFPIGM